MKKLITLSLALILVTTGCSVLCRLGIDQACDEEGGQSGDIVMPTPTPVPASGTNIEIRNRQFILNGQPTLLRGYGDYGMVGDVRIFPNTAAIDAYLDALASHGVNFTRVFVDLAGAFGPYRRIGNDDFILTGERATFMGQDDQWNIHYWNRLTYVIDACDRRGIVVEVVITDHWKNYAGDNYGHPDGGTFWDWTPWNPHHHAQCGMPLSGPCEDFVRVEELTGELLFPGLYINQAGRRTILAAFVDRAMAAVGDHRNVLFEVMNEPRDGTTEQILNFCRFIARRIESHRPDALITCSFDAPQYHLFAESWIDYVVYHGLCPSCGCNAGNISGNNIPSYGKPVMIEDDGCCWGVVPGNTRDNPVFVRAVLDAATRIGYSYNSKQCYDPNNLNWPVLDVFAEFAGIAPAGIRARRFDAWSYRSLVGE